jgi:hypothetical protein
VRFSNIAGCGSFTTAELHGPALHALGVTDSQYSPASFSIDPAKLWAKGLVEKIPRSRRYRLIGKGSTASTNTSPTTWMHFCGRAASKSPLDRRETRTKFSLRPL